MTKNLSILRPIFVMVLTATFISGAAAQRSTGSEPRQEKLLNGLKVLLWNDPDAAKVEVKLRIHSGAAFDPQGREGVMKLLTESFFPNKDSREFFEEDLGGDLEIECNYDYIEIEASSRPSEFLRLLEAVAAAISNPAIDRETTAELKAELLAKLKPLENDPEYLADRAVSNRLFGTFPYGRPEAGSPDSVQNIDFADLRFAKDRLLTADNATLAIRGKIDPALALRAARRYFGSWLKADKKSPSTFRQPDAPPATPLTISKPDIANSEVRYAIRGVARADADFAAAEVLERVLAKRFIEQTEKNGGLDSTVAHYGHIQPGVFIFRYKSKPNDPFLLPTDKKAAAALTSPLASLFAKPVTESELATAKNEAIGLWERRGIVDRWLDVDTFKTGSVANEAKAFQAVTVAGLNALLQKLADEPAATAVLIRTPSAAPSN